MAKTYQWNRLGSAFAPLLNWLNRRKLTRWLMERLAGIDRRRSLPAFRWNHFRRWFHRRRAIGGRTGGLTPPARRQVLLLDDCFTTFNEPHIGRAAVRVLEHAGYTVELAGLTCCCRPMISKGYLAEAKELIAAQAAALARRLEEGMPILGLEPSCILTLVDEWPELLPGEDTRRIAKAAALADGWLADQVHQARCQMQLSPRIDHCLLHGHCHQKTLVGNGGTVAALKLIPQLQVKVLDAGCCGMAGSFGYEKEHYDLSVAIANLALLPALSAEPDAVVVAPGTSCRHQIKDLAKRRALHPMEVLAQQLGS